MTARIVLHIDMDAFFASVEQRDRPELRGQPVIVGADPRQGLGRGVVTAASYEARAFGVHSAMPITRAWRACPHGVYVRPRFGRYSELSDQIFATLSRSADAFEPASIDEAYADVTGRCGGSFDAAARLAAAFQRRVSHDFGLTCSIGIGPNKLVAKIATDLRKPAGIMVVSPGSVAAVLGPLPARRIPGVGPKTSARLAELGIETIGQLAAADPDALQRDFGAWGPEMVRAAQGSDDRPVDPSWERKSTGAESTFMEDLGPDRLGPALDEVVEEAMRRLRRAADQGRTVTLKVRLASFETFTRARTLPAPTDDPAVVAGVAHALLDEAAVDEPVRLLGVRVSGLERAGSRQASLAAWPADILGEAPPWTSRIWRF